MSQRRSTLRLLAPHSLTVAALALFPWGGGTGSAQDASVAKTPSAAASTPATPARTPSEPPTGFLRTGARKNEVVRAIQRVKNSVVNIHSERTVAQSPGDPFPSNALPNRVNGMGTGIIVDPRGYIVTNHHVVEDVSLLRIRLADGTQRYANIVARLPEMDLALLKIDPPSPLSTITLGTASDLMEGETVIAIGNAFGYEHTVSVGIVSATKRDVTLNKDMSYKSLIQTDASINPGNSGGPLVNIHGELVGVNVAIRANAQGIGFAIQVDDMIRAVGKMLRTRRAPGVYEGLVVRDVLVNEGEQVTRKVVVDRVEANSPAAAAGLKTGDVLVRFGGSPVACSFDVDRALLDLRDGQTVQAVVRRKEEEKSLEIGLASTDSKIRPVASLDAVWAKLGLQLVPVASETVNRVHHQLNGGLQVTNINAGGVAAKAGIRKGDILVGLDEYETTKLDDVHFVLNNSESPASTSLSFFILRNGQLQRGQLGSSKSPSAP